MEWEAYIPEAKKNNPASYCRAEPEQYGAFGKLFNQMHPSNFTAQKLFLVNHIDESIL